MKVCVNKRDAENDTRELIVENKLWYINDVLLIVDQMILRKNGQLLSLSLKKEESLRKIWIKFVNRKD